MGEDQTTDDLKAALENVKKIKRWVDEKSNSETPPSEEELKLIRKIFVKIGSINKELDDAFPDIASN